MPVPGSAAAYLVGGLWLLAAVLFVTAAALLAAGRAAWRLTALAAVLVSVPVIGLAPGQAVAGLIIDGLILVLVGVSWLRTRKQPVNQPPSAESRMPPARRTR